MTIPGSIVKAARIAIYTAAAAAVLADDPHVLEVVYDDPSTTPADDIVAVLGADRVPVPLGMVHTMGAGAFMDTATVHVFVGVFRAGDEPGVAFNRACDLVDQVVNAVRADPTLGGTVLEAKPTQITYGEAAWDDTHNGRRVQCDISVAVQAPI